MGRGKLLLFITGSQVNGLAYARSGQGYCDRLRGEEEKDLESCANSRYSSHGNQKQSKREHGNAASRM